MMVSTNISLHLAKRLEYNSYGLVLRGMASNQLYHVRVMALLSVIIACSLNDV